MNAKGHFLSAILLVALLAFFLPSPRLTRAEESSSEAEALALNFLQHVAVANFSDYDVNVTYVQWNAYAYFPNWHIGFQLDRGNYSEAMDACVSNGVVTWFCAPGPFVGAWNDARPTTMTVQSNDTLKLTRDILASYGSCVNGSYCTLLTTLTDQALADGSSVLNAGNFTITLSHNKQDSSFKWTAYNNTSYLDMKFTSDGHLTEFINGIGVVNLSSLSVSSGNINVSEEQAVNIAMPYALNYTRTYGRTVESANATLSYYPGGPMFDPNGNGTRDPYTLYPAWDVTVFFTGLPAGKLDYDVFGFQVRVWADNGHVAAYDAAATEGSSNSSPASALTPSAPSVKQAGGNDYLPVLLGAVAAASFIIMSLLTYHRSRGQRRAK